MTYQDTLKSLDTLAVDHQTQLAVRVNQKNPNHHLWNNRGTWWCHFTLHRPDFTAERIRVSLETQELKEARRRRDALFCAAKGLHSTGSN